MHTYDKHCPNRFPLSLLLLLSLLAGCAQREQITEPDGPGSPADWELGPTSEYPIPSGNDAAVADSVSGCVFVFPEGGSGSLRVSRILAGSEIPTSGEGFEILYDGEEPLHMEVEKDGAAEVTLMGYGQVEGCFDDELAGSPRWISAPVMEDSQNRTAFLLTPPFEPAAPAGRTGRSAATRTVSATTAAAPQGFTKYWIKKIQPGSDEAQRRVYIQLQADSWIEAFLAALSPARRALVAPEIETRLRLHYEWDGEYYKGFWWRSLGSSGRLVHPTVHLNTTSNAGSVAHELGHYLTHTLVGDDTQSALEGQAPFFGGHGIRDVVGREQMVEEYAYLVQFFLTGTVGALDLLDPYSVFRDLSPLTRDFPGVEGFPSVVLASLARSEPQMRELISGRTVPVPVVDLSWAQIFDLYPARCMGIEALRSEIEQTLGADAPKLPVILQRSGWSYSIKGRYVDASGDPLQGYTTQSVYRLDGQVYEGGWTNNPSGSDGHFAVVGGVFGGRSELRVVQDGDTAHVPIEIDWSKLTNESVDVGNIEVSSPPIVLSVEPTYAKPGDTVHVNGQNFGFTQGNGAVFVGGIQAAVTEWTDWAIAILMPGGLPLGETQCTVTRGGVSSVPHPVGVDNDFTATLRETSRIDLLARAPHQYEPWWIGEDSSFDHHLQVMTWDGFRFEGGLTEETRTLVFSGVIDPVAETASLEYTFTDTRPDALVKSKHVRIERIPVEETVPHVVNFIVEGSSMSTYFTDASWMGQGHTQDGGLVEGSYTGTDWTWPESYYMLALTFRW